MSSIVAENKQSKISQNISGELVEQVIYIFQNHLAPMVETAINGKIERAVQNTHNRSTNTDSLLTRAEFLTAMQLMEKRFDDLNKRFNFIQWLIGIGFVAIPLLGTFLQNILN